MGRKSIIKNPEYATLLAIIIDGKTQPKNLILELEPKAEHTDKVNKLGQESDEKGARLMTLS
jgi:hypothetical protein